MKTEDELYQDIEKFLSKDLDAQALQNFEAQKAQDPALDYQVKLQSMANDLVLRNRLTQVAERSKTIQQQELSKQKYIKYGSIGILTVAILLSGYFGITKFKPKVVAQKEMEHAQPSIQQTPDSSVQPQNNVQSASDPAKPTPGSDIYQMTATTTPTSMPEASLGESIKKAPEEKHAEPEPLGQLHTSVVDLPKSTTVETKVDPCKNIILKADIHSFPTCAGEQEGAVSIAKVQGGQAPYQYKLVSKEDHHTKGLQNLSSGTYLLTVTDANNCAQAFHEIVIHSKTCNVDVQFNPQLGETWEVPIAEKSAELTIFDNRGVVIYKKQIPTSEKTSWDGKMANGYTESGVFLYLLKYSDGSQKQGSITLLQ